MAVALVASRAPLEESDAMRLAHHSRILSADLAGALLLTARAERLWLDRRDLSRAQSSHCSTQRLERHGDCHPQDGATAHRLADPGG